ncbi:MAG: cob(I)yrinic acid a,c-diamide adenosyltransferase [Thermoguttaceae bacterium]|jgi:cob(I)alamin adenosyltransferase
MSTHPDPSSENRPPRSGKVRVYSRRGDLGETSLFTGPRVGKDHLRIEAAGTIDELGSFLGLARAQSLSPRIDTLLETIQKELINIGAEITAMNPSKYEVRTIRPEDIRRLEEEIDAFDALLPPTGSFLIPGGTTQAAVLHVARSVCRRVERKVVALVRSDPEVSRRLIAWFNRLGDLLFVLARSV